MAPATNLRDVGTPTECSLNLVAALDELRRTDDLNWVIEKLEANGLMENGRAVARRTMNFSAPEVAAAQLSKRREWSNTSEDRGIPVEDLKRIIRELKLNTGQSFWKNHVTRENLIEVLLSYFRAREPTTKVSINVSSTRDKTKCNYDSIRQGLLSVRTRHETVSPGSEAPPPPSYLGLLANKPAKKGCETYDKGGEMGEKWPRIQQDKPSISAALPRKSWRDFATDSIDGMLYQARVGISRNWHPTKEFTARNDLENPATFTENSCSFADAAMMTFSGTEATLPTPSSGEIRGHVSEADDTDTEGDSEVLGLRTSGSWRRKKGVRVDEVTLTRRKCAKSIYELSTRPDKGALLVDNGVLEALAVLSGEEDPETIRYVGATYVNLAGLNSEHCRDMLKAQVVRCLHRLWMHATSLAYQRNDGWSRADGANDAITADESDDTWRVRKCGLDVVYHVAIALCHLTMIMGSENIMMQERGLECIMWYARDSHGNERQKMLGLQCLVNFHLHAPTGTLHEAILPCLGELGQSDSVLIRRFTGDAVCAIAGIHQGAAQLLSGGVLGVLAVLPTVPDRNGSCDQNDSRGPSAEQLLVEVCAQATSLLTRAKDEFVKQALNAPETVSHVLDTLFRGGIAGGIGDSGSRSNARTRAPKICRLHGSSVLSAIFCQADASDMVSLVQLGFIAKAQLFLKQALDAQDLQSLEVLCHSMWQVSVNLSQERPRLKSKVHPRPATNLKMMSLPTGSILSEAHAHLASARSSSRLSSANAFGAGLESGRPSVGSTGASEILGEDVSPTNVAPGTGRGGRRRTSVTSEPGHVTASAAKHSEIVNGNAVAGVFLRRDVKGPPRPSRMLSKFTTLSMRRTSLSGSDSSTATMVAAGGGVTGTASGEGRTQSRRRSSQCSSASGEGDAECKGSLLGLNESCEGEIIVSTGASSVTTGDVHSVSSGSGTVTSEGGEQRPHIVECGLVDQLLQLATSGSASFIRECCTGALCNLARKPWITADTWNELGLIPALFNALGDALAKGEDCTCSLAAKGLWNLVSRLASDRPFLESCLSSGVVGGLCRAARGAADLLEALTELDEDEDESRCRTSTAASRVEDHFRPPGLDEPQEQGGSKDGSLERNEATEAAGDDAFRYRMRDTVKACLRTLHAILRHKWARSHPAVREIRGDLLTTLVSCGVAGAQVGEVATAVMCNLTHDVCCELDLLEETGTLRYVFRQAFSYNKVVLRHVAGTLGNLTHVLESTATGARSSTVEGPTVCMVLRKLADTDDLRVAFRCSAILYGLTRKPNYVNLLPDLTGVSDTLFKLFRSGVLQTQTYCLQAFFNLAHNKNFAISVVNSDLMEDFIVACMVQTNSSHIKEMSSQVLYNLISNPNTRNAMFGNKGLWTLVQLAAVSGSVVSMRLSLLALFNLACDLRVYNKWLDEHTLSVVLDFDDEVLGAPAYPGLLYLASTHQGRLVNALISTRIAREATVKMEGLKFLRRNRALEDDEEFLARATAAAGPGDEEQSGSEDSALPGNSRHESCDDNGDGSLEHSGDGRGKSRLRGTFARSYLLPTLAMVYNLCCKSAQTSKLLLRERFPEVVAGLLKEMRAADDPAHYHPQVEMLCVAILGSLIEEGSSVPKLIGRRITPSIVQGLDSRIVPVRLASLWALLLLSVPTSNASFGRCPTWMLFCRQAVIECKAVTALRKLWSDTGSSLPPEARDQVRYAVSTAVTHFLLDQAAAAAVVRQRGVELLAETMGVAEKLVRQPPMSFPEESSEGEDAMYPSSKVSTLCSAVPTVYLPGIPVQSVCEGLLTVLVRILPTYDDEVRDLCSLAMRCLAGKDDILIQLIMEPRFVAVLNMLLEGATQSGGDTIRAILRRVVVLWAAPDVADLSPALLDLTDCVFQRPDAPPPSKPGTSQTHKTRTTSRLRSSSARPSVRSSSPGGEGAKAEAEQKSTAWQLTAALQGGPSSDGPWMTVPTQRSHLEFARMLRMAKLRSRRDLCAVLNLPIPGDRHASGMRANVIGMERESLTSDIPQAKPEKHATGNGGFTGDLAAIAGVGGQFMVFGAPGPSGEQANLDKDEEKIAEGVVRGEVESGGETSPSPDAQALKAQSKAAGEHKSLPVSSNMHPPTRIGVVDTPQNIKVPENTQLANPSAGGRAVGMSSLAPVATTTLDSGDAVSAIDASAHRRNVGRHTSVALWGLLPHDPNGDVANAEKEGLRMLAAMNDLSDGSSNPNGSSDEQMSDITYNDAELRQVKRLMFRVVEAEFPIAAEDSVEAVNSQLREVARTACARLHRASSDVRNELLRTRKGQAIPLPRSARPPESGAETSRGSIPDSGAVKPSTGGAESPVWDPALEVLRQTGMEGLDMTPRWELNRAVNLCTARFVEEGKSLPSAEVATPPALPDDLVRRDTKHRLSLPRGMDCCVLAPLVRPPPEAAHNPLKGDGTTTAAEDLSFGPFQEESEDRNNGDSSTSEEAFADRPLCRYATTSVRRKSADPSGNIGSENSRAGGAVDGGPAVASKSPLIGKGSGAGSDHPKSLRRASRRGKHNHQRHASARGCIENAGNTATIDGDTSSFPASQEIGGYGGAEGAEGGGSTFYPPLSSPSDLSLATTQETGKLRYPRSDMAASNRAANRSIIRALDAGLFSLRTKSAADSRAAGQVRHRLLTSLGVGKRRTGAAGRR